jgi:tRNA (guanine37-N1)-methyltransferase
MRPQKIKVILKNVLTKKEKVVLRGGYDVVGDIAIIEVPTELAKKEGLIAKTLLNMHKNITVVTKKSGSHKGIFRLQKLKILAGEKRKETVHKENNVRLKLNLEKTYFSPRMAAERKRIAQQVKKGERILVMFSGCAPYPLVIAKNSRAKEVYGVEINPVAHRYGLENVKLNKIANVNLLLGDVKKIVPKLKKKFDRVVMPLPKSGANYLNLAITAVKVGGIVHFYDFLNEKDVPTKAIKKIGAICKRLKKKYKIMKWVKCGQLAPRAYRVCVDFKLE